MALGAILLVATGVVVSSLAFRQLGKVSTARTHTLAVISLADDFLSELKDAETGQRGYAITGDESFLKPYRAVLGVIRTHLAELRQQTSIEAARKQLDAVAPLLDAKLTELDQTIELRRGQDLAGMLAIIRSGRGKDLMETIRSEMAAFRQIEAKAEAAHEAEFESNMRRMFVIITVASVFTLILAGSFAYMINRRTRQQLENQALLETQHLLEIQNKANEKLQQANLTLQVSEEKLAVTLHSIGDGVIATDATGRVTFLNPVAELLTGWNRTNAEGRLVDEMFRIINQETRQSFASPVTKTLAQGTVQGLENHTVLISRDGTERSIADSCAPIRDRAGRVVGAVLVFRDVTDEYAAQQASRDSATLIQAVLNTVADGIITLHATGGLLKTVNPAAEKMFGYPAAELIGRNFNRLVPEFEGAPRDESTALFTSGAEINKLGSEREVTGRRKDGSMFPIEIAVTEMWLGGERHFTGILRDITARHRADEELRRALGELNQANSALAQTSRLKDEFLAKMSHELRTPLNAILGLSEALLEQISGTLSPRQLKSVTTISTSGQHLLALINDILDLSKIEAGKLELNLETVNLDEFCQSCLIFVRTQAMHKQIDVAFEHDGRGQLFAADPKRFKQVLVNLLTNAVKFTREGGHVGLRVSMPKGKETVLFTVWDTGIGIAPADAAKLFTAFTQVDSGLSRAQEGTGLGLALVAKLVELHGGSVALESDPGKGSRFIVTLPRGAPSATPFPRTLEPVGSAERWKYRRALVIEDDPTAGAILVDNLAELGIACALHARGDNAIDVVLRERPDVILLDIQLPGESGWVVLAKLKEHPQTREIPVVVVSVVDEPRKSHALGAVAHFTKPVTRAQLGGFFQHGAALPAGIQGRGPVILLVEDNEANIQTVGGYLEDKGYTMHYAVNGLLAVKLTREINPALILMDIQMPVMDGLAAIGEIRADARFAATPIVALTALAMMGDRERCLAAGATDYLSKPVSLKALAALVEQLAGIGAAH